MTRLPSTSQKGRFMRRVLVGAGVVGCWAVVSCAALLGCSSSDSAAPAGAAGSAGSAGTGGSGGGGGSAGAAGSGGSAGADAGGDSGGGDAAADAASDAQGATCTTPAAFGSCDTVLNGVHICTEYYGTTLYAESTQRAICDGVGGSTYALGQGCTKTDALGRCVSSPAGDPLTGNFYYGTATPAYQSGCESVGGAAWCAP